MFNFLAGLFRPAGIPEDDAASRRAAAAQAEILFEALIARTLRVPAVATREGSGETVARQLDVALMPVGFKLSRDLLEYLGRQDSSEVADIGRRVLSAVGKLLGDHVKHNVYFKDFPKNVPDTLEFWLKQATHMFMTPRGLVLAVDLDLNRVYGRYQHSYEDMLKAHEEFLPSIKDRVRVLSPGGSLADEANACLLMLASSAIPLNESDRKLLEQVAEACPDRLPSDIPMRENLAIINKVRVRAGRPVAVDAVGDILRLACALSDGDVTLQEPTKFKSIRRPVRRALLSALDEAIKRSPAKLGDVARYREPLKRLGERLHPHEHPWEYARDVFAVARGEKRVTSLAGQVETAFAEGDIRNVIRMLEETPGGLMRSLDRVLCASSPDDRPVLLRAFEAALPKVAGRLLLSVREHLHNRVQGVPTRLFANSRAKAWVAAETRAPLEAATAAPFVELVDAELLHRLPPPGNLLVDRSVLPLAIPSSDKNKGSGFGVMPRGSVLAVEAGLVRFFIYWRQKQRRTDYDLSAIMLNDRFVYVDHLSYTNLESLGGVHSGDITEAPEGASEFIDVDLTTVDASCIVPTVSVFSGEGFTEVEECFFGFMQRSPEQKGKPFEAATVRMKSDMRGSGRVCLPLAFLRGQDGRWSVRWMHLYLAGLPQFNAVENSERLANLLTRAVVQREYVRMEHLVALLRQKADSFAWHPEAALSDVSTYVGLEPLEGLPASARSYTLGNLHQLVPQ